MPRDSQSGSDSPALLMRLPPGPLGPRWRVRGLRGNPAFADWLQTHVGVPYVRVLASAGSGIVRVDVRHARQAFDWEAELLRAIAKFGAANRPCSGQGATGGGGSDKASANVSVRRYRATRNSTSRTEPVAHQDWHSLPQDAVMRDVDATVMGLSGAEAHRRLQRKGANEIADITGRGDLEILLDQFRSIPVALLAGSGAIALASRAYGDAAAIAAVLAANGGIGFLTERQAERTVSALRALAPRSATVLRDGRLRQVPAREVVVGDVLVLKPGDAVAADARVIESHRLSANEAMLTGESLPVRKEPIDRLPAATPIAERRNMLFMGSVISGGAGRAVVVATGERTVLGRIRALAQSTEPPRTRLQTELDGLGQRLAVGAAATCLGVFAIGALRGRPWLPLLRTAVSLGVAAIPEGLPTVATSLIAAGIRTLRKHNVYARSLDAIENLGAVDVVGFDKTGTLTQNRMSVASVVIGRRRVAPEPGFRWPTDVVLVCALCNDVERARHGGWQGSSTEIALLDLVSSGANIDALRRSHRRIAIKQRSEHHPYMVTLHADSRGRYLVAVKGRPQEVLERCTRWFDGRGVKPLSAAMRRTLLEMNDMLAARGERVLALAIKRQTDSSLAETGELTWLGLVGLADPLRPGIAESIARFRAAGIRPLMLTGDQIGTARAVAREAGLDGADRVADAGALPEDARQLGEIVDRSAVFARSSPAMKLQIIRALQAKGHVVAMTGDGINDGPALKVADVGVAMGVSGTDFAHAMSDIVLQDDHPDGLLAAIAEGRTSYLNVKKAVQYLVSTNVSELALMGIAVAAGLPDPLDPIALLWTNLITDVSPAIALGLEPPEPDILHRPPFPRAAALLSPSDWRTVAIDGAAITGAALAGFLYGLRRYGTTPHARTIAFMTLTSAQLLYALTARSEAPLSILGRSRLRTNPWLTRTVALSLGVQAATVLFPPLRRLLGTVPLNAVDAALIAAGAALPTIARELRKRLRAQPA